LVLVVDDAPAYVTLMSKALEGQGVELVTAGDLQSARDIVRIAGRPDLVLLDLLLPDGNGLDILPELKRYPGTAVVVVSGKGEELDRELAMSSGADGYVVKPFSVAALREQVRALLAA
jgi:DNA-binding response OmpR family regulator